MKTKESIIHHEKDEENIIYQKPEIININDDIDKNKNEINNNFNSENNEISKENEIITEEHKNKNINDNLEYQKFYNKNFETTYYGFFKYDPDGNERQYNINGFGIELKKNIIQKH